MAELGEVKRKIAEYEANGETDKAIAELVKAVKVFPKEGSLLNKLGDLYIKGKNLKEALDAYEMGARVFKEETYFPNAIALCKKILRLDKERTEVYGLLGELHKELDQRGEAANYLLEYAERKIKQKDLEVALNTYNTIKELVPNNAKILQTISAIYEQMGKKDEANELLKEANKIENEQGKLKQTFIKTEPTPKVEVKSTKIEPPELKEIRTKKPDKIKEVVIETSKEVKEKPTKETKKDISLEEFVSPEVAELLHEEKADVSEPKPSAAEKELTELSEIERTVELGELYLSLGSEDEAIDCFRNAANEAWQKNDYDKSLDLNRRIAELRPFDLKSRQHIIEIAKLRNDKELQVKFMLELAETLNRREAKKEAQSLYRKIIEIDPNNIVAHEMLAVSEQQKDFIDLGEVLRTELEAEKKVGGVQSIEELISEFRREVFESIGEGDYHSHYDLGVAYKGMDLIQEAIEEFEIAAKDENLKLKAIEMVGSCFLEREKIDDALKVLNEGLKISNRPKQEYFGLHFLIGNCYQKQNNSVQALRSYINAYNIDKNVPDLIKEINILKNKLSEELGRQSKSAPKKSDKTVAGSAKGDDQKAKKSKITYL